MKFVIHKRYDPTATPPTRYWFTIVAANGEPIAASEMFTRKESAQDTIAAIKAGVGADTPIDDQTLRRFSSPG